MCADQPLRQEEIEWITAYNNEVATTFCAGFERAYDRFRIWQPLINRFSSAIEEVKAKGNSRFRKVEEAQNELCIASALLEMRDPLIAFLEYEPPLPDCARSIDFRATTDAGVTVYVDVKTINPIDKDRSEQFKQAHVESRFPKNVFVALSKLGLDGQLWHYMFAGRSSMLTYSLELEEKIADGKLFGNGSLFVLAFCGNGFRWHEDELEDFVSYYYSGTHRKDDPFGKMEALSVEKKKLSIARTISRFACMHRPKKHVFPKRLNWNVQTPHRPHFESG